MKTHKFELGGWIFSCHSEEGLFREGLNKDSSEVYTEHNFEDDVVSLSEVYADNEISIFRTLFDKQERELIFENREINIGFNNELNGFFMTIQTGDEGLTIVEGEDVATYDCEIIELTESDLAELGDFFKKVRLDLEVLH